MAVRVDIHMGIRIVSSSLTKPRVRDAMFDILQNAPFKARLTEGTDAGKVDLVYHRVLNIAAGSTTTRVFEGSLTDEFNTTLTFVEIVGGGVINFETGASQSISYGPTGNANGMLAFVADVSDARVCYPARAADDPGIDFFYAPQGVSVGTAGSGNQNLWVFTNNDGSNAIDDAHFFVFGRSA